MLAVFNFVQQQFQSMAHWWDQRRASDMGVKHGRDVLHSLSGLTLRDVADICKVMASNKKQSLPVVDADCNNLRFRVSSKDARSVANHLSKWALHGLRVTPVCDGDICPVCKQASNE